MNNIGIEIQIKENHVNLDEIAFYTPYSKEPNRNNRFYKNNSEKVS